MIARKTIICTNDVKTVHFFFYYVSMWILFLSVFSITRFVLRQHFYINLSKSNFLLSCIRCSLCESLSQDSRSIKSRPREFALSRILLTLQAPPPRFSFHQRVFSMWSLPSSWSFRMAPLMAVLYGESEVPSRSEELSFTAFIVSQRTFAKLLLVMSQRSFPRTDVSLAIPREIASSITPLCWALLRSQNRQYAIQLDLSRWTKQSRLTRDLARRRNDSRLPAKIRPGKF